MPHPEAPLTLPLTVDGFTLTTLIGVGPMGEMYQARETATGRPMTAKLLDSALVGNVLVEARFRSDAEVMKRFQHPGVPVFAALGQLPDGRLYQVLDTPAGPPTNRMNGAARSSKTCRSR